MNKCPICNNELPIRLGRKKSGLRFCSDDCRAEDYHRRRLAHAMQKLSKFGFEYISGDYINSHSKLTVKNPRCGHTFIAKFNNIFTNPDYCSLCGKELRIQKTVDRNKQGIPPKALAKFIAYNQSQSEKAILRRNSDEYKEWDRYAFIARRKSYENFRKNKHIIDPLKLRSPNMHIDHIVPVAYCFKNKIPVELCYSIENLKMSSSFDNCSRRDKLNDEAIELLNKWGYAP